MPTYEYRCPLGHEFEKFFRSIGTADAEVACPTCGKVAERKMSAGAGLLFKGSGFYLTDYGKNAHQNRGPSEVRQGSGGEGGSGEGSGSGSGDAAASGGKSEPGDAKKGESKSGEPKASESRSSESRSSESRSSESKPAEAKPSPAPPKPSAGE